MGRQPEAVTIQADDAADSSAVGVHDTTPTGSKAVIRLGVWDGTKDQALAGDSVGRAHVVLFAGGVAIGQTTVNGQVAINTAVKETPVANPGDSVWQIPATVPFNTTAATKVTVVEYTVPANKEFYVATWALAKMTSNNIAGQPGTLEVRNAADTVTTLYDKAILEAPATGGFALWQPPAITPVRIAQAGEKVRLTITPSGATTTEWFGKIVGLLRSI